jgi:hypothetical protein
MLQTLVKKRVNAFLEKSGRCLEISTTSADWRRNRRADPQLNWNEARQKLTTPEGTMAVENRDWQEWSTTTCREQGSPW